MFHNYHTVICKIAFSVSGTPDLEQNILIFIYSCSAGQDTFARKEEVLESKKITWPDDTPPQIGEHVSMELASNMFEVLPASPRDEGFCDGPPNRQDCVL